MVQRSAAGAPRATDASIARQVTNTRMSWLRHCRRDRGLLSTIAVAELDASGTFDYARIRHVADDSALRADSDRPPPSLSDVFSRRPHPRNPTASRRADGRVLEMRGVRCETAAALTNPVVVEFVACGRRAD
jgi:hypothetical protein